MIEPGRYVLHISFENLESQRTLLKQLAEPLGVRNKFLIKGLINMLDEIEWQEKNTNTSCQDRKVTLEIERASQPAQANGSS